MLFSRYLPLPQLITLCQALRVNLHAGLTVVDVFRQQSKRGSIAVRPVATRIRQGLESGGSLEDVLKREGACFPPLFHSVVGVGEQTGNLAEVCAELEQFYRQQLTLRRQFMTACVWPIIQFVMAVGVITLLLLILGWISSSNGTAPFDVLGIGVGPVGAIRFLLIIAFLIGGVFAVYMFATRILGKGASIHRKLLALPGVGPSLHALALMRFCMALKLTLESGLSTHKALKRSFDATANPAYMERAEGAAAAVKRGDGIDDALAQCHVFPQDFLEVVHTGEESGQLPEVMGRQSEHYREVAAERMKVLTLLASLLVWLGIAILIIVAIFRIMMSVMGVYDQAFKDLGM
jgi:type IV pilus assembly protein PilC